MATTTTSSSAEAFVRFERDGWSRVAEGYHRFFSPVTSRVVDDLLDAAHVGADSVLLDVATGPGDAAARAADRGASVLGTDIAEPAVQLARRRHPGVGFRRADAHDLPFAGGSFTAVVANFLLPHLADHERALGELTRVLAPGGRLAVSTWDAPERAAVLGLIVAAVAEVGAVPPEHVPPGPPFFAHSSGDALAALLRAAGLREVRVRTVSFVHRVGSSGELWDGVLGGTVRTAALVRAQPPGVQRRIRAAFDRAAAGYAVDGGLDLPVSVKIASGMR